MRPNTLAGLKRKIQQKCLLPDQVETLDWFECNVGVGGAKFGSVLAHDRCGYV